MMPHVLTRSLDRASTLFILIVAGLGILIPLSNLLLPEGSLFQVPTYAVGYAFQVDRYLDDPGASQGIEMHCLPQQAVFQIAAEAGCVPLEIREDNDTGHPSVFVSNTFLFGKR